MASQADPRSPGHADPGASEAVRPGSMGVVIRFDPRRVTVFLGALTAGLVVAYAIGLVSTHAFGHGRLWGLISLFNLDSEFNFPTYFSVVLLLFCSGLLALIGALEASHGGLYPRGWKAMSAVFLYLSIDEEATLHERLCTLMRSVVPTSGLLYFGWVIPYAVIGAVLLLVFRRFLIHLPPATRRLTLLAGLVYVAGAMGFEMAGGYRFEIAGEGDLIYDILAACEESLEMVGLLIFIHGLTAHIDTRFGRLLLGPLPHPPDVHGDPAPHAKGRTGRWSVWLLPLAGLVSLIWFCSRVVPKPSRALYPCQRAAMPLASGFVAWLIGLTGASIALNKGRRLIRQSRWPLALACLGLAAALGVMAVTSQPQPQVRAAEQQGLSPIGEAKGIHPGRVVWVHDPNATNWEGPGHGHPWEAEHTDPAACDRMMSRAVRELTGEPTDAKAWDALFRFHNKTHNKGDVGYTAGQKIAIKVNFVGFIRTGDGVDSQTYSIAGQQDYMNTSPQIIAALLRQLTQVAGVRQADIGVGDGSALFPNEYYGQLHRQFPDVKYLDGKGGSGRTLWDLSTVPLYWSCRPQGVREDFIPRAFAEAQYLINLATLKGHTGAGVTLCAKNHYGSLGRMPPERGYYDLHRSAFNRGTGQYRNLVDLVGHSQIGGKTVLYLIDALYCGTHMRDQIPKRWASPPFNGDWTSSLFASEDPVAIDSVGLDFLRVEAEAASLPGTDDYLREAALANNPPSGTFYDPDHATGTARLASLGAHEHWNNPTDKQYSRNLGKDAGIELVQVRGQGPSPAKAAKGVQVYIGTYTGRGSEGIYLADLDVATGELRVIGKTTGLENPTFLAMDPAGRCVYAVRESNKGAVVALSRDSATGGLTILNEQPSGGQGPCYLTVDRTGRFILVANYGSGSVAVLPIGQEGSLQPASSVDQHAGSSVNPSRQKGPHAHCIDLDPGNRFALAADLGTDRVCVYRFEPAAGKLTANDPAFAQTEPGAGPRHLAFHPNGKWVYVIEEMGCTITSSAYSTEAGTLKSMQRISTLLPEFHGSNTCAEVQVHPSGRFLYGSNRGHNSIACFSVDAATGQLRLIGHEPTRGNTPRHFAIDPSGQLLLVANQDSHTIVSFRINPDTGKLSPTGQVCQVPNPVCILIASR